MSNFLFSERCPKCAAKGADRTGNNLAVYDDGHKWCYACGFYVPGDGVEKYLKDKENELGTNKSDLWFTPSTVFTTKGLSYLKRFGLTEAEIQSNFFWDDTGYLVFIGGKYQSGRNFNQYGAKYLNKGIVKGNEVVFQNLDSLELLSSVVIVEDAISAIKVSRICSAVPLHNAVIPLELILRLSRRFNKVFLWLDPDKQKETLVEAHKLYPYFDEVSLVWSGKDPKYYTNEEIKGFLKSS